MATIPGDASGGLETVAVDLTPWLATLGPRLGVALERDGGAWAVARVRVVVTALTGRRGGAPGSALLWSAPGGASPAAQT